MERHGHTREVESLADFDRLVASGATRMRHWRVQSLDLTGRTEELMRLDAHGSIFLGCALEHAAESALRADGGLVFPPLGLYLFKKGEHYAKVTGRLKRAG